MSSAWTSSSTAASRCVSGLVEFSTVYWPGWLVSRMPAARARAPTRASSGAHARGWSRKPGRSGCEA
jgi:hypothetical protein